VGQERCGNQCHQGEDVKSLGADLAKGQRTAILARERQVYVVDHVRDGGKERED
jgi:hypothetical protein